MKHTACLSLLLALLLALSLPAAALEAAADSIAALGDQELLTLYQLVTREAKARELSLNVAISCPAGRYIVGQDIAEGVYRITCTATAGDDVTRAIGGLGSVYEGLGGETRPFLPGLAGQRVFCAVPAKRRLCVITIFCNHCKTYFKKMQ